MTDPLTIQQGQLISSSISASCHLHWPTHSAYLLEQVAKSLKSTALHYTWHFSARVASLSIAQVNSYCSTLAGQLVRGDAVLTAEHACQASSQAWIAQITARHKALNNIGAFARASKQALKPNTPPAPARFQEVDEQKPNSPVQGSAREARPFSVPQGRAQSARENATATASQQHPSSKGQSAAARTPPSGRTHAASSVADDTCEPRGKLLWRLVGQASSVSWEDQAAATKAARGVSRPTVCNAVDTASQLDAQSATDCNRQVDSRACVPVLRTLGSLSHWGDLQQDLVARIAACVKRGVCVQAMVHTCRYTSYIACFLNSS